MTRVVSGPDLRKWLQRTGVKIQSDVSKETLAEIKTEFDLQDLSGALCTLIVIVLLRQRTLFMRDQSGTGIDARGACSRWAR